MPEGVENIYPYRREKQGGEGREKTKGKRAYRLVRRFFLFLVASFNVDLLITAVAGFFIGRAVLLGELYPFGAAYTAGIFWLYRWRGGFFAAAGTVAGLLSAVEGQLLLAELTGIVLAGLSALLLPPGIKRPLLVVPAGVFAVIMVARSSFLAFTGAGAYDFISVAFEAIFAALFAAVVINAVPALSLLSKPGVLKGEEVFYLMALAGALVAGTGGMTWGLFSLKSLFSYFFILLAALIGGPGLGAATGAVVGVIPGLAYTSFPDVVGAYSFSGLLAGFFRPYGKPGVITGFLLGNIILSLFASTYQELAAVMAQTALVAVIFCILPRRWLNELRASLFPARGTAEGTASVQSGSKELLAEKIERWSALFDEIAAGFRQTVAGRIAIAEEERDLQALFAEVGQKVCRGCSHRTTCWEREFYKTYQSLLALFTVADSYGRVTVDDLDEETRRKCNRSPELVMTVNFLYELYKLNSYWSKRLQESKEIVADQLKGISGVIRNLAAELEKEKSFAYRREAEAVKQKLAKTGIKVAKVEIYGAGDDSPEVVVTMPHCGGRMLCRYEIGPFLSRELGCRMSVAATCCCRAGTGEFCTFRVYPRPRYQVSLGASTASKEGNPVSGDDYLFLSLPGGKFALLLSDGMGTGQRAADESNATLRLTARLLDSGLGRDLAVKTVNSLLMLRSPEDSFATLDMVMVDIYDAGVEITKIGAPPGYIVRGKDVEAIKAQSLPVGIVNEMEAFTVAKELKHGDMLVMVTDGVWEAYKNSGGKEDWLEDVLQEIYKLKPQEVADLIVNLACAGNRSDDMTAVVAKVEQAGR